MANIPGAQFSITGASGVNGLLGAMSAWRSYVFPRGGYASQASTGTTITFDTAAVASRFAVNQWIQAGLLTANIRQVSGVGGNSITISGANLTVAKNDRIYLIGNTQPTVTGGSATYTTPASLIYQRDDDTADLYTNSMITSDSNGLIQIFGSPGQYDVMIQDGNQSNQGSIIDLPIGADGVSTSSNAYFGASVTIAGALGVTGWATFGVTTTIGGALGVTGWATFGSTVTMNAQLGVTGWATFGSTTTINGAIGATGWATFGSTVTVNGALGVTNGFTVRGGATITTGIFGISDQPRAILYNASTITIGGGAGATTTITWDSALVNVGPLYASGSTSSRISIPIGMQGFYIFSANVPTSGVTGNPSFMIMSIRKNGATVIAKNRITPTSGNVDDMLLSVTNPASANDYYEVLIGNISGGTSNIFGGSSQGYFTATKLF